MRARSEVAWITERDPEFISLVLRPEEGETERRVYTCPTFHMEFGGRRHILTKGSYNGPETVASCNSAKGEPEWVLPAFHGLCFPARDPQVPMCSARSLRTAEGSGVLEESWWQYKEVSEYRDLNTEQRQCPCSIEGANTTPKKQQPGSIHCPSVNTRAVHQAIGSMIEWRSISTQMTERVAPPHYLHMKSASLCTQMASRRKERRKKWKLWEVCGITRKKKIELF